MDIDRLEQLRSDIIRLYKEVGVDTSLHPNSKSVIDLLCRMTEFGSTGLSCTNSWSAVGADYASKSKDQYKQFLQLAVTFCTAAKNEEDDCVESLCVSLSNLLGQEGLTPIE